MKKVITSALIAAAIGIMSCGKSTPQSGHADTAATSQAEEYYTCPMHPQVRSDKAGVCPLCGMDLVKASLSRTADGSSAGMVSLNENDKVLANVSTTIVGFEEVTHVVRAFGTLEIAEPNKAIISARFGGRIEKLHVDAVGANVRTGEPLFDVYSPDLIQAQSEYLQAHKTGSATQQGDIGSARTRLLLLGLTEGQIQSLETSGAVPQVVTYHSPANGIVMEKKIVRGTYISEGATLYEISDISTLWNIAEIYESEAAEIRVGASATLLLDTYPGLTFPARVDFIYPVVSPQLRTLKVRLIVANRSGKLKPNMYTETIFIRKKGRSLTVPVGAVLKTGRRNLVYVKAEDENKFEAREVGLGSRFDRKYEITWGLTEGETVVSEGGYLIDSESQLRSGGGTTHEQATPATKTNGSGEPAKEHKH